MRSTSSYIAAIDIVAEVFDFSSATSSLSSLRSVKILMARIIDGRSNRPLGALYR
nr:MAG TPA: hypothetical protein [Caudoviricetes sp.]